MKIPRASLSGVSSFSSENAGRQETADGRGILVQYFNYHLLHAHAFGALNAWTMGIVGEEYEELARNSLFIHGVHAFGREEHDILGIGHHNLEPLGTGDSHHFLSADDILEIDVFLVRFEAAVLSLLGHILAHDSINVASENFIFSQFQAFQIRGCKELERGFPSVGMSGEMRVHLLPVEAVGRGGFPSARPFLRTSGHNCEKG